MPVMGTSRSPPRHSGANTTSLMPNLRSGGRGRPDSQVPVSRMSAPVAGDGGLDHLVDETVQFGLDPVVQLEERPRRLPPAPPPRRVLEPPGLELRHLGPAVL